MALNKLSYMAMVALGSVTMLGIKAGSHPMQVTPLEEQVSNSDEDRLRDFNSGWKFMQGDFPQAVQPAYDDQDWQVVSIPHDYSIIGAHHEDSDTKIGPFSKASEGGAFTGYTVGGDGWYRKRFVLDDADAGKVIKIHFDGIYSESEVWINGHRLGFRPNGYVPFYYDVTPFLQAAGETNVIAVKTRNHGENSRWYAGSGIYRDVQLSVTSPIHIVTWGLSFNTVSLTKQLAKVKLVTTVSNQSTSNEHVRVKAELISPTGRLISASESVLEVEVGDQVSATFLMDVKNPSPWSVDNPQLYQARITVFIDEEEIDRLEEPVGIRTIDVTPTEGLKINGTVVKLKGANIHHDNGLLGARALAQVEERKVQLLKDCGYNAIRTSHNPPSKNFLDACDRLGMLVMNEFFDMWEHPKKVNDYHQYFKEWSERDLAAVVARDKNHPSVIMWSIGNEVYERADSSGIAIARRLADLTRELDPTRPVTAGVCEFWDHKGRPWEDTDLAFQYLDIAGYNYQHTKYETDHRIHPQRIILGTESYAQEAYDNWQKVQSMPWVIGDFVWTGMDYIGEAGIGHSVLDVKAVGNLLSWPWYNAWCGDIDITGVKKSQSYYRDVVWGRSALEIAVRPPIPKGSSEIISDWGWPNEAHSWTWPGQEGRPFILAVYTHGPRIRVEVNGRKIDEKAVKPDSKLITLFEVPYEPGEIKVTILSGDTVLSAKLLKTAGQPAALKLIPEAEGNKIGPNDFAYVHLHVVDADGNLVPNADIAAQLSVVGDGVLEGVGNASPTDLTSFGNPMLSTFQGRALAIMRAGKTAGKMTLVAKSEGLVEAVVEFEIQE